MSAGRRLSVDRTKCIGAGQCIILAAEHFDLDDDGFVKLLSPLTPELAEVDEIGDAVSECPTGALSWQQDSSVLV